MDLHYKMMLSRLQGKQCFFQVGLDSNLQEKKKKKKMNKTEEKELLLSHSIPERL